MANFGLTWRATAARNGRPYSTPASIRCGESTDYMIMPLMQYPNWTTCGVELQRAEHRVQTVNMIPDDQYLQNSTSAMRLGPTTLPPSSGIAPVQLSSFGLPDDPRSVIQREDVLPPLCSLVNMAIHRNDARRVIDHRQQTLELPVRPAKETIGLPLTKGGAKHVLKPSYFTDEYPKDGLQ
jgi:hypothetical protein